MTSMLLTLSVKANKVSIIIYAIWQLEKNIYIHLYLNVLQLYNITNKCVFIVVHLYN